MVPLKPNELSRDVHYAPVRATRPVASTGMRNADRLDDTIDDRWAFSLRAEGMPRARLEHICAFPTARVLASARRPAQLRV